MVILETKRLQLAEVTLDDAPFFVELMNSPHWVEFIGDRHIRTIDDAKAHLKKTILKSYADNGYGFYKVQLKKEGLKTIGICGIVKRKELEDTDIGFGFLPAYEGRGYGYESSKGIMELAKERFHLDRIAAICVASNKNSIHLIKKLGLVYQNKIKPFEDDSELLLFVKNLK